MKKISELVTEMKSWIALLAIVAAISAGAIGLASMPKKVEAVESKVAAVDKKVDVTQSNVEKLAGTIDKYVMLQAEDKKAQGEREQLMLKLIEAVKDSK
jgi:hypothetical protein